jgi:multidrug efflux pump subunit AcrA (membrane-fusion protein)
VRREGSVLVVSHTNSAVDQAILEIVHDLGDDLVDGSVLRLGTPRDQRLAERERLLAETHIKERSQELLDRQAELLHERADKTVRLEEVRRLLAIAEWRAQADTELERLRADERALEAARERKRVAAVAPPAAVVVHRLQVLADGLGRRTHQLPIAGGAANRDDGGPRPNVS